MDDKFRPVDASFGDNSTQTIELTDLFTRDLTTTGSFDVKGGIWKTTFGKVLQALPIPALLIDQSFQIVVANHAWKRVSPEYEVMQGLLLSKLFPEASFAGKVQSLLEDVFSTREPVVAHATLEVGDSRIWARMTFRSIRVMEERFVLLLVEDLTANKQILEQNKKHREQLEKRVEERTSELMAANAQLKEEVAERKRMEMALRESEERYRLLAENSLTGIYVHQDGKFVYINRRAAEILGYSANELVGKSIWDLVAPEDREMTKGMVASRLQGKHVSSRYQFRILTKIGEVRWMEVLATNIKHNGRSASLANVVDITDRQKAEEALRESEDRFRTVADWTYDWEYWIDPLGRLKYISPSCERVTGFVPKDFIDDPGLLSRIVHPADRETFEHHMQCVHQKDAHPEKETLEFRIIGLDGTEHWIEHICRPVYSAEGAYLGRRVSNREVTEQKQVQEALRESEEQYRAVFDNAGIGIDLLDRHGRIVKVNEALLNILGYAEEELSQRTFLDITHPDDKEISKRKLESLMAGEIDSYRLEKRYVRKDGGIVWVDLWSSAVRAANGEHVGTVAVIEDITHRKLMEDALRGSEEKYRRIVENTQELIYQTDMDGRLIFLSPSSERLLGYTPDESLGRRITRSYAYPEERTRFLNLLMENGSVTHFEAELTRKDGSRSWLSTNARLLRDENGNPIGVEGVSRDVTARKIAEEALRESEQRLSQIINFLPDATVAIDREGRVIAWNKAIEEMTGVPAGEMMGKGNYEYALPFYGTRRPILLDLVLTPSEEMRQTYFLFTADRDVLTVETDNVTALGKDKVLWARASALYDMHGTVIGAIESIRDITDRKKAEKALLESEERYRQITENSLTGIFLYQDGRSVYANRRLAEMLGYSPEEVLSVPFLETIHPDDRLMVKEMAKARLSGQPVPNHYELRLLHKDGSTVWSEVLSDCVDYQGRPAILGNVANVTQSRTLEGQLRQAQKLEAVGTLAGGIAHDFNNLLTIVMGFSELLLAEKDQKHPEYADLQKIFHAAKNGAELVQRLLMFSRKSEPKPVPTNLNKQIVQVEKLLRRTIPKMIDIQLELSADLPDINADPSQVEQVLINLGVNARDAMPDGGKLNVKTDIVTLDAEYCGLHIGASPGEHVVLEVSDTGHGMDKETVEHIFDPFFTTKEIGRGTGLGLAIVYGIVTQHNGHITVYSEVGKGTTFRVYLPAIPADVEPDVEDSGIMPGFGTETVLLVDDEEFVRELGVRILTKQGYTVLQAANGREALDVFGKERSRIFLVILDLIMPQMGGKECLKEILRIDPQMKVLVASGFSADSSIKEFIQMGAKGFVNKPFRVNELVQGVRKVLDES
jgi:two-component system, cell cycle sensor histidine kinase and response regulator CckA